MQSLCRIKMQFRTVLDVKVVDVEKRRNPSKHYVYVINVTYSDNTSHIIYRRYSKFFDLQQLMPQEAPPQRSSRRSKEEKKQGKKKQQKHRKEKKKLKSDICFCPVQDLLCLNLTERRVREKL